MIHIGTNNDENENLYRCPECRQVHGDGHICCAEPMTFLEMISDETYERHCKRKKEKENA